MQHSCSLRLDIIPYEERWAWRIFHRTSGANQSISAALPFPINSTATSVITSFKKAAYTQTINSLQEWGTTLSGSLFPRSVLNEIATYHGGDILFMVPEQWAEVPFELMYLPGGFLCRTFSVGTIVYTHQESHNNSKRRQGNSILIIADPAGDIPAAYKEGMELRTLAISKKQNTHLLSSPDKQSLCEAISKAAVVHFAGHSKDTEEPQTSGWQLEKDVVFDLFDIENLKEAENIPWLLFSNSCYAGTSGCNQALSGIAGAFLKAGVAQVIGPASAINDNEAHAFALHFYELLFKGMSAAHALTATRAQLSEENIHGITPLLYRLYGDPCFKINESKSINAAIIKPDKKFIPKRMVLTIGIAIIIIVVIIVLVPWSSSNVIYVPVKH